MILLLLLLAFSLAREYRIQLTNLHPTPPKLDGVSWTRGGAEAYASEQGLSEIKRLGLNFTHLPRASRKRLPEIKCSNKKICSEFVVGYSARERLPIGGLLLSVPGGHGQKPRFGWQSTIHGDEVAGVELLLNLAKYLQETNSSLLNDMDIYIIPILNPDGYVSGTRSNGNWMDLNRNFPDHYGRETQPMQPETRALVDWFQRQQYAMSVTYHGGSLVVNYPLDCNREGRSGSYAASPDDALFRLMASTYADLHPRMRASSEFPGGITNGNEWYCITGSLQDYMYWNAGSLEVTIEASYTKDTRTSHWEENRESMLAYMNLLRTKGVRGVGATQRVNVLGLGMPGVEPLKGTRYYRLLAPGKYQLEMGGQRKWVTIPSNQRRPVVVDWEPKGATRPLAPPEAP